MLRITRLPGTERTAHLRVEGRLTAAEAGELLRAAERPGGHGLLLDVARVTFADPTGVEVLRRLADDGATLLGCSQFLRGLLDGPAVDVADEASADAALARRIGAGDDAAFEEMVRAHAGRLLAVARRMMGGNEADARDVLQDAFLQAHRAIGGFQATARLATWLHRIVVNAALMKLRGRRRRPEDSIDDLLPRFTEDGHHADAMTAWPVSTEELLSRRETRETMRRLIAELPETARTVLVMRDIEDLDTDEVAAALGITPNAVKVRLHRARQALRTLVVRELGGASVAHAG